jgi:hypothetical protein
VAIDATELPTGLAHGAAHQRSALVPSRQGSTFLACSRQSEIIASIAFLLRKACAGVGGTSRRATGRDSPSAANRLRGATDIAAAGRISRHPDRILSLVM